ncbi:unnamed protein product, partial [Discosporangium mesarthrocarpum]
GGNGTVPEALIVADSGASVELLGCHFQGGEDSEMRGAGLGFLSSSGGSSVRSMSSVFEGSRGASAVRSSGGIVELEESIFANNHALSGGAIFADGEARVTVMNSMFFRNQASG